MSKSNDNPLIRGCCVDRIGERWSGVLTVFTLAGESRFGRQTGMPEYETEQLFTRLMDSQYDCWVEVNRMIQEFHATGKVEVNKYHEACA